VASVERSDADGDGKVERRLAGGEAKVSAAATRNDRRPVTISSRDPASAWRWL
jgi:hypothetical protein